MLLFGSVLGALWMMTLYGVPLPVGLNDIIRLHRSVQFDGFITMLIMGIGYMILLFWFHWHYNRIVFANDVATHNW